VVGKNHPLFATTKLKLFSSYLSGVALAPDTVLSDGHYWHPFLCFEDCTVKELGEGGAQSR
jgi:hypothetical protein